MFHSCFIAAELFFTAAVVSAIMLHTLLLRAGFEVWCATYRKGVSSTGGRAVYQWVFFSF